MALIVGRASSQPHRLIGEIRGPNGGAIPGAAAVISDPDPEMSGRSDVWPDANGDFAIGGNAGDYYRVVVGAPGFERMEQLVQIPNDVATRVSFILQPSSTGPPSTPLMPIFAVGGPSGDVLSLAGLPSSVSYPTQWQTTGDQTTIQVAADSSFSLLKGAPGASSDFGAEYGRTMGRRLEEVFGNQLRATADPKTSPDFVVGNADLFRNDKRFRFSATLRWSMFSSDAASNAPPVQGPQTKVSVLQWAEEKTTPIVVTSNDADRLRQPWWRQALGLLSDPRTQWRAHKAMSAGGRLVTLAHGGVALEVSPSQTTPRSDSSDPQVKLFFVDRGQSSGTSVRMTVVNEGSRPVMIVGDGFVLEPVRLSERDLKREIERLKGKKSVTVDIDAYCLDMRKPAPASGMVMRLAPHSRQATMGPVQRIIAATRALYHAKKIQPDSDPVQYRHALLQWAIWTLEQKFNEHTYTQAFINHSRKNIAEAGRQWTPALEKAMRTLAPARWKTIERVFRYAGLPLAGATP